METKYGYCKCGCNQKTNIAPQSSTRHGWVKGQPVHFCHGHNPRRINTKYLLAGYVCIYKPDHPRANRNHVFEHIVIAETILGKALPDGACVHHIDGKRDNNLPNNLVICENSAYHTLIHRRQRAYKACGHSDWRKCKFCKQYDAPQNLYIGNGSQVYHHHCVNTYNYARLRK